MTKLLNVAFAAALNIGQPNPPQAVMAAIAAQKVDPGPRDMEAFANRIWEAFQHELKFLSAASTTNAVPNDDDMNRWANLLSWMIVELRDWTQQTDVGSFKLDALLILADFQSQDGDFWHAAPDSIGQNDALLAVMGDNVRSLKADSAPDRGRAPISTAEADKNLKCADATADWETLGEMLPHMDQSFYEPALRQTVKFLGRFGFDRLVMAAKKINQIAVAFFVVQALGVNEALRLAVENVSLHMKFTSVFHACNRQQSESLDTAAQVALEQILVRISTNEAIWLAWMKVFNTYPVRFPYIQTALGITLASVPLHAIANYVESVELNTSPSEGRNMFADCLRIFHQKANLEIRQHLWRTAHKRWQEWDFDRNAAHPFLPKISLAAIDYAIVGYFVECVPAAELELEIQSIIERINMVDRGWHSSISDCISARNRLLSQLQPLMHARHVLANDCDWLKKDRVFVVDLPPVAALYMQLKYSALD